MTWLVTQNTHGELQLIQLGAAVPDGWTVLVETANPDYLNQIRPVVPQSITRAQAVGALILAGLDERVTQAIDAIPNTLQRRLVRNDWENRLTFERDNPTLMALSRMLEMSEVDLDQLFIKGSQL